MTKVYIPAAGWYALEETPPEPGPGPEPIPGVINIPWALPYSWYSYQNGGWACHDIKVFGMAIPVAATGLFKLSLSQYDYPAIDRTVYASSVPGSFDTADMISRGFGSSVGIILDGAALAGKIVYFNCKNWSTPLDGWSCDIGDNVGSLVTAQFNIG